MCVCVYVCVCACINCMWELATHGLPCSSVPHIWHDCGSSLPMKYGAIQLCPCGGAIHCAGMSSGSDDIFQCRPDGSCDSLCVQTWGIAEHCACESFTKCCMAAYSRSSRSDADLLLLASADRGCDSLCVQTWSIADHCTKRTIAARSGGIHDNWDRCLHLMAGIA